jgi:hypothetical protein
MKIFLYGRPMAEDIEKTDEMRILQDALPSA